MKKLILIILLFGSTFAFSQVDTLESFHNDSLKCIRITQQVQDSLVSQFSTQQFSNFFPIINLWIDSCGYYEPTLRSIIMEEIVLGNPVDLAIQDYFDAGYYAIFQNRCTDAQEYNYHDFFMDNVVYYGYLPLNSKLDSVIQQRAFEWKDSTLFTPDERLICTLFAGNLSTFENEALKKEYKKSIIGKQIRHQDRDERDQYIALLFGTGWSFPLDNKNIIGVNQSLKIGFSSLLSERWIFDFIFDLKINYNSKHFDFFALNTIHSIKPSTIINAGGFVNYRLFGIRMGLNKIYILPKFGVGFDFISTDIYEVVGEEEFHYYNPTTLDLTFGVNTLIPLLKTSYLGIGFNFHYIPYNWDHRVKTPIDSHYLSGEVFWRI
jgi:hypothetical protein